MTKIIENDYFVVYFCKMIYLQYGQNMIEMNDDNESEVRELLVSTLPADEVITVLDENKKVIEVLRLDELF